MVLILIIYLAELDKKDQSDSEEFVNGILYISVHEAKQNFITVSGQYYGICTLVIMT